MDKQAQRNEERIKRMIVDGYKRGVCTHDGGDIPMHRRGMAGKGSHFIAPVSEKYRTNFDKIEWRHRP